MVEPADAKGLGPRPAAVQEVLVSETHSATITLSRAAGIGSFLVGLILLTAFALADP
jgi:hypothetical protein